MVKPLDGNLLSVQNIVNKQRCIYVGANATGENIPVGIISRVVNTKERYNMIDDTMIVSGMSQNNEIIHGRLGLNLATFRQALSKVHNKVIL